jgi:hypothetical protein
MSLRRRCDVATLAMLSTQSLHFSYTVATLSLPCRFTVTKLLLYFDYAVATMSLRCLYNVAAVSLHNGYTVATMSLHCCYDVVILRLYCRHAAAMMFIRCRYTVLTSWPRSRCLFTSLFSCRQLVPNSARM